MTPRPDRPRCWINAESLALLKARATPDNDRWTDLLQMCDTHMQPDWDRGVFSHSLAYLVTGNAAYAQTAIRLFFGDNRDGPVYGGTGSISGDQGYVVRTLLPDGACVLDWLYPVLTPSQRADLIACLEAWANWVWPETNASRAGAWAVDSPGNNYFSAFLLGTWSVGLALYGLHPRAQSIIDLARLKFAGMTLPYLNGLGKGGMWPEDSSSYGVESTRMLFLALEANRTATGEDLLTSLPWAHDAITAQIHMTTPDMSRRWPWGDQPQSSLAYLGDHDRSPFLIGSRFDSRASIWLDAMTPNRNQLRANLWEEPLWYTSPVPAGVGR